MLINFLTKLFGSKNDRELKKLDPLVAHINSLEPDIQKLTDDQLRQQTQLFRERLQRGESIQDLLPEAFATVREASRRVLKMRHFDVQLIGGMVLHQGRIAEMKTGEGKTLVATLPAYLNALSAKGVHVVTVNDYLARRDTEWMGQVYRFLGLSVGTILHGLTDPTTFLANGGLPDKVVVDTSAAVGLPALAGGYQLFLLIPVAVIMGFFVRGKVGEPKATKAQAAA